MNPAFKSFCLAIWNGLFFLFLGYFWKLFWHWYPFCWNRTLLRKRESSFTKFNFSVLCQGNSFGLSYFFGDHLDGWNLWCLDNPTLLYYGLQINCRIHHLKGLSYRRPCMNLGFQDFVYKYDCFDQTKLVTPCGHHCHSWLCFKVWIYFPLYLLNYRMHQRF